MDVATIAKLFSDGPLPAICALLVLSVAALFLFLMRAHRRELALLERVATLTERLAPLLLHLAAKVPRKRGNTGSHPVLPPEES